MVVLFPSHPRRVFRQARKNYLVTIGRPKKMSTATRQTSTLNKFNLVANSSRINVEAKPEAF